MNAEDARHTVDASLRKVAPELSGGVLEPDDDFREIGGLDSMDFLNLMIGIHEATGLEIPERDYPQLATLAAATAYVAARA